jgi:hypothetical protein
MPYQSRRKRDHGRAEALLLVWHGGQRHLRLCEAQRLLTRLTELAPRERQAAERGLEALLG